MARKPAILCSLVLLVVVLLAVHTAFTIHHSGLLSEPAIRMMSFGVLVLTVCVYYLLGLCVYRVNGKLMIALRVIKFVISSLGLITWVVFVIYFTVTKGPDELGYERITAAAFPLTVVAFSFFINRGWRKKMDPGLVLNGLSLLLGFMMFSKLPVFLWVSDRLKGLIESAMVGARAVFGEKYHEHFFLMGVCPASICFAGLIAVLNETGILKKISWFLGKTIGWWIGVSEDAATCLSANILVGQTEAVLCVKHKIDRFDERDFACVFSTGFSGMSLGAIASLIGMGVDAECLIASILMSPVFATILTYIAFSPARPVRESPEAPAVNTEDEPSREASDFNNLSATLHPTCAETADTMPLGSFETSLLGDIDDLPPPYETMTPRITGVDNGPGQPQPIEKRGILAAFTGGVTDGAHMCFVIVVCVIAFVFAVHYLDGTVSWVFTVAGMEDVSLPKIVSYPLFPVFGAMGVEPNSLLNCTQLFAAKLFSNERVAYEELMTLELGEKTLKIMTIALGSFASLESVGMMGGVMRLYTARRTDVILYKTFCISVVSSLCSAAVYGSVI